MSGFLSGVLPILIIVSIIVTVHELGHYWVARLFGTRIDRFSVGFGSVLFSRTDKRGVEWCVSALPLGGYVKFAGDDNISSMSPSLDELEAARTSITEREGAAAVGDYFHFKPLWQRFLIILAGPAMNFVLAIFLFTVVNLVAGEQFMRPTVAEIVPGSAAAAAGFRPGDTITNIDGHAVESTDEARVLIILRAQSTVPIVVTRGGQSLTLPTTLQRGPVTGADGRPAGQGGTLGVRFNGEQVVRPLNPLQALIKGNDQTWGVLDDTLTYVGRIFTGKENGDKVGGILGMTQAAGNATMDVAQAKIPLWLKAVNFVFTIIQMSAYVSVSIGFLNLLPIPVLDGGHLAFYLWQAVTRKPVSMGFQNAAFRIAVVLIIGLVLFANLNDMNHLGWFAGLSKLFGGVFS